MAKWWLGEKEEKPPEKKGEEGKKDDDEFELKPKEVADKLKSIDNLRASVDDLSKKVPIFDRMAAYLDEQDRIKADAAKKKATEQKAQTDEELENEFLTDPANATKKLLNQTMSPFVVNQINTNSTLTMRDMFTEEPEYFEYAHDPTIRREVEGLVTQLPLDKRDKESIRNCYLVVEGRHKQEIKEGKIKARVSAASSSGTGTGAPGSHQEVPVTLTDAEKKAAAVFGMKPEDYAKAKKELSYV